MKHITIDVDRVIMRLTPVQSEGDDIHVMALLELFRLNSNSTDITWENVTAFTITSQSYNWSY